MKKRLVMQRLRKVLIFLMIFIAAVLMWPMIKTPHLRILMPAIYVAVPEIPKNEQKAINEMPPKTFVLKIASKDPKLLLQLQEQGWPSYLKNNEIEIGPYLEAFKSQLDLAKISQMTPIPVRIAPMYPKNNRTSKCAAE